MLDALKTARERKQPAAPKLGLEGTAEERSPQRQAEKDEAAEQPSPEVTGSAPQPQEHPSSGLMAMRRNLRSEAWGDVKMGPYALGFHPEPKSSSSQAQD